MSQPIDLKSSGAKLQCLTCGKEYPVADGLKHCPDDQSLLCPVAEDKLLNSIFDQKYEIQKVIGAGGFGRVYKARHLHTDKVVAVKIMTANFRDDPVLLSRFNSEARATNKLVHANIVGTLDHGVEPKPYIVMEYVEGETLEDTLKSRGPLSIEEFLAIFEQVCLAMTLAHQSGFLHRDLKPSNIMIDSRTGQSKILDFGLVKMQGQDFTTTGEIMGSPPYMSPEQCKGEELDQRTDVYSLGCVMYEALTGVKPFEGKTAVDCMYKHFGSTPAPISSLRSIPKGLDYVVAKSLADISDRYTSMEQLRLDLRKAGSGALKGRLPKIRRPSYRKTVKVLAQIAAIGNWTILITAVFLYCCGCRL